EKDRIFDAIRRLRKPAGLAYRRAFESLSFNPWYVVWAWAILGVLTLLAFALGFSESLARSTEDRTADAALKTASGLVLIWTSVAVGWMTWTHIQFVKRLDPAKIRWEVIDADDRQLPAALRDDKLFLREVKDWMGEDEGSANAEESGNRKKCLKPIDSADPATNRHRELALHSVQTGLRHKLRADICQEVFEFLERALPWPCLLFAMWFLARLSFWDQAAWSSIALLFLVLMSGYCLWLIYNTAQQRRHITTEAINKLKRARAGMIARDRASRLDAMQQTLDTYIDQITGRRKFTWSAAIANPAVLPIVLPVITLFYWLMRG
ncbi:MAG: hypothetical protein AAF663_03860, partial [Planctomycetota bacterium]